jgi:hypothetical protein
MYSANSQCLIGSRIQSGSPEAGATTRISGTPRTLSGIGISVWVCLFALISPAAALSSGAAAPTIVSGALTGSAYAQSLAATGTAPITWSVTSGALPAGLSLGSSTGIISGIPTATGVFTFTITATNAAGSNSTQLSLIVSAPPTPPSIVTTSPLPSALTGSAYTQTLAATGTAPITWSVTSGTLPAGLSLGSSTGIISGTPTAAGVFTFTITAANAGGSNSTQLSLTVNTAPSITTLSSLPAALTGSVYTQTLAATGTAPITWSVTSATLPAGLSLGSATGVISGTPTAAGVSTFTITATNAGGSNAESLSMTVNATPSITTVSTLPAALTGSVYTQTLAATGTAPITWSITSGALPAGLSLASSTGIISGTPAATGSFTFTVTAVNAGGSASKQVSLSVTAPVTVSLTPPTVSLLPSQSQTFTATVGGTSTTGVTWSISPALGGLASGATSAVYVAPSTAPTTQTVTITATTLATPSQTATAVITLPQTVTVSVSPSAVGLTPSSTQQFTATVSGASNTAVTWSINPSIGTISSAGLYTAPSSIPASQTVTVTAQSVATPTTTASATISLTPPTYTYYVDSVNGSDSNPGTQAAPWKTIAKVNATTLLPGQSVAFKAGGLWREQLTVPSSGSFGNPITFTAYGSGTPPEIAGSNVVSGWSLVTGSTYQSPLALSPTNIYVDDPNTGVSTVPLTLAASLAAAEATPGSWYYAESTLYVQLANSSNPSGHTIEASVRSYGIYSAMHSFITVEGLYVKHGTIGGIYFQNTNVPSGTSANYYNNDFNEYITIQGNTVWNYGAAGSPFNGGIYLQGYTWGNPPMLRGEQILNNTVGRMDSPGSLNYDEGGIEIRGTTGALIEGNSVATVNNFGITVRDDYGSQMCNSPVITHNTITLNRGNIAVSSCPGAQVTYNLIHDSLGYGVGIANNSGSAASNNVVLAYNLIYNLNITPDTYLYNGFDINQASLNGVAYNNTIYGVAAASMTLEGASSGWLVENNIFDASANNVIFGQTNVKPCLYIDSGVSATYQHNLFNTSALGLSYEFSLVSYGGYVYYATFHADFGDINSVVNVSPMFNNPSSGDFTLMAASPAIGAGVYIPGVSTANPPNIGAK